jgi:NAD(P)-dependent dehydrogenase (short-subunit alcohol dehydrogenase family)
MDPKQVVAVYGASGHTGRFVVAELVRRGLLPVLSGRDRGKLEVLAAACGGLDVRAASVDDDASLDRALAGTDAIVNCAGPFVRTADPVIQAALRARIPYVDVAAEIEVAVAAFETYGDAARHAGVALLPAAAFYGGLGDLLATAAMGDWERADDISIAYGLSSWSPTHGTRATSAVSSARRNGRHFVFSRGALRLSSDAAPRAQWQFPEPLGLQDVVGDCTMADAVTISHHVRVPEVRSFMTLSAVRDVTRENCSPPVPVDESGRSSQTFLVDVVARSGNVRRRATARGRDIYAVTAPLVVEAIERLLREPHAGGVFAAGELFDARDFLSSLAPDHLTIAFDAEFQDPALNANPNRSAREMRPKVGCSGGGPV